MKVSGHEMADPVTHFRQGAARASCGAPNEPVPPPWLGAPLRENTRATRPRGYSAGLAAGAASRPRE